MKFGLTTPLAIIVGAIIIGGAIITTKVIAPYEMAVIRADVLRLNTVSGELILCDFDQKNRCR